MAAHQQCTLEWWDAVLPKMDAFVSPVVLEEISRGDTEAAEQRLSIIESYPLLEITEEAEIMAERYFVAIDIPEKARADAYHLSLATVHGVDFMVTWNCNHIASGRVRRIVDEINAGLGIRTPVICTPEELMEV
ncbi:MAG: type II toxin-antitoxin system VapC family toxin [Kiritimatiellia bacterium]|nr:type II toxin-antitoxin system VapC family toxin [Kiritimatiellia bacterium]